MTINEHVLRDLDALLPEQPAATLLGVKPRTLQAWRQRGGGPRFVRISSRAVRYRRKDLVEWVESHLCSSTSDSGEVVGASDVGR